MAALVIAASIAPGWPLEPWAVVLQKFNTSLLTIAPKAALSTLFERLVTFAPLGFLAFHTVLQAGRDRPAGRALVGVAVFCVCIEALQTLVVGRHPRLFDLLVALGFAWLGVMLAAWLGTEPRKVQIRKLKISAVLFGNCTLGLLVFDLHNGADIKGWDCGYPLLVGNERTLNRPWTGQLQGLAIYPTALEQSDVEALGQVPFSEDTSMRNGLGAIALYDFSRINDGFVEPLAETPGTPRLRLPEDATHWTRTSDALRLDGQAVLEAEPDARAICAAIMETQSFSVEVVFASDSIDQRGPARIISQSTDVRSGNFLFGQDRDALVFRARTPWNGPYGAEAAVRTSPVLSPGAWHHGVATMGHATASIFVDGTQVETMRFDRHIWLGASRNVRFPVVAATVFVLLAAAVSGLFEGLGLPQRALAVVLCSSAFTVVVSAALSNWFGHDFDNLLIVAALAGPAVGIAIYGVLRRRDRDVS